MKLKIIKNEFSICKVKDIKFIDFSSEFLFVGKTDEEISIVCSIDSVPKITIERDDGWKGFRVEGQLDFSLVGILSKISNILANNSISIFALSTFNTDYIMVKECDFIKAIESLKKEGYTIV
jgi:hypothetical protein